MTDRINSLTLLLDDSYREDDPMFIKIHEALNMVKGINHVIIDRDKNVHDNVQFSAGLVKAKTDIRQDIFNLLSKC